MSEFTDESQSPEPERRQRAPAPSFGELLADFWWPSKPGPRLDALPWLVANGYAPDRRKR